MRTALSMVLYGTEMPMAMDMEITTLLQSLVHSPQNTFQTIQTAMMPMEYSTRVLPRAAMDLMTTAMAMSMKKAPAIQTPTTKIQTTMDMAMLTLHLTLVLSKADT